MPTRWTRTSASPGPQPAGSSISTRSKRPGSVNRIAFIGVLSPVSLAASVADEDGLQVPVVNVLRDVGGNDRCVLLQRVGVPGFHLGRDFESHVEQLAEVRVEPRAAGVVSQGSGVVLA